ncbi:hypothetical protein P171DRAFT_488626 [Karstenula rhodostoma CBS 690.94]|uniref:Uncharacterized protein n=1 Tax=Karstenula rhodostoma CBS 690.94 TaxID=1392251 RepID=A0A9P4U9B9_9PLEO|nr:hypothetical protein P171DRAFT_488626 [Karstenula rhodostoma CBS 690.94]
MNPQTRPPTPHTVKQSNTPISLDLSPPLTPSTANPATGPTTPAPNTIPTTITTPNIPLPSTLSAPTRLSALSFPPAPTISQTSHALNLLHKRLQILHTALSRARTYPNPSTYDAHALYTEALAIQDTAARLAAITLSYVPGPKKRSRENEALVGETENSVQGQGDRGGADALQGPTARDLAQLQDHTILKQWRTDKFAGLVREAERVPREGSLVVRTWFPGRREAGEGGMPRGACPGDTNINTPGFTESGITTYPVAEELVVDTAHTTPETDTDTLPPAEQTAEDAATQLRDLRTSGEEAGPAAASDRLGEERGEWEWEWYRGWVAWWGELWRYLP